MRVAFFALITILLGVIAFVLVDGYNDKQKEKAALQAIVYEGIADVEESISAVRPDLVAEYVKRSIICANKIAFYDEIAEDRPLTDIEGGILNVWTEQKAAVDKFLNELQGGGCNVPELETLCAALAGLREKLLFI